MRRALIVLAAAVLCVAAAPAGARSVSLPTLFATQVAAIKKDAKAPPILLPASMPLDVKHPHPEGGPSGSRWSLDVGAVEDCHLSTACFVAFFDAVKSTRVAGHAVKVKGASKAGYIPLSCGASCASPQIQFIVHGIRYTIQATLLVKEGGDRAALVKAAESAIAAGPR